MAGSCRLILPLLACSLLLPLGAAAAASGSSCSQRCGRAKLPGQTCSCDYYCHATSDCCSDFAEQCPSLIPTLDKGQLVNCGGVRGVPQPFTPGSNVQKCASYRPGQCYCDSLCGKAGDCCNGCGPVTPLNCPKTPEDFSTFCQKPTAAARNMAGRQRKHANAASNTAAGTRPQPAQAAAAGAAHDCGFERRLGNTIRGNKAGGVVTAAASSGFPFAKQFEYERKMQRCQAEENGSIARSSKIIMHVFWYATVVCPDDGSPCYGGDYSTDLVWKQIAFMNNVFARHRIAFVWDGVIDRVTTNNSAQVIPCDIGDTNCYTNGFLCTRLTYKGDKKSVRVVTVPDYLYGDGVLGSANEAFLFQPIGDMPDCIDYTAIYEKTLPGLGAVSAVDGGPSDNGQVLTHEVAHYLAVGHTWYQSGYYQGNGTASIKEQCELNASEDVEQIVRYISDGVRDTPPQSLNGSFIPGVTPTSILRFVKCDEKTGAYTNTSAFAQQSCTAEHGFPAGEPFYNNYNNLMSYGDKSCLRLLTPGQGARARCAWKCLRKLDFCPE